MLLPVYFAVLAISAGIVGVFGRRAAALGGFVPDFDGGLAVAALSACLYIVSQCGFNALLQVVKPNRGKGPYLTECLSLGSAVILLPYLLNVPIPWPHPKLEELAPLIFLGAFGGAHGFFKLATLFAATQAPIATPARAIPFAVVVFFALIGAQTGYGKWHASLQGLRTGALPEPVPTRLDELVVPVRELVEGIQYPLDILPESGEHLTFRWRLPEAASEPVESMHVTCAFRGEGDGPVLGTLSEIVTLAPDGWLTLRIPAARIPEGSRAMGLSWALREEPAWVTRTGLRPAQISGHTMLMAGPYRHEDIATSKRPNLIVVLVEGLGADHMNLYGYERMTTPQLAELAKGSVLWENAFSNCPDTLSTTVSLFTGLSPLQHGYTGAKAAPLPADVTYLPALLSDDGYATVAFTEGEGPDGDDLVPTMGVDRGFQEFNPDFPQEPRAMTSGGAPVQVPLGARETLQLAADWIRDRIEHERFLVFVRIRELRRPFPLKHRYGDGFIKPWEAVPQGIDVYDTAVTDVDKQLGLFAERLKELGALENSCLLITSPYGLDFSEPERAAWRRGGKGQPRLTEESLRVPLLLTMPEGIGRVRRGQVTLDGMGNTLAQLAGVTLVKNPPVSSLLAESPLDDPIAVWGDPVVLSIRTPEWRLNWNSGRSAETWTPVAAPALQGLYSLAEYREKKWATDQRQRQPELVRALTATLESAVESAR